MAPSVLFTRATFDEVSKQFLELRKQELRESTIRKVYKPAFKNFLLACGDKPLASFSPVDVQIYIKKRLSDGLSGVSVNFNLRCLKCFGRWCAEMEILPERNSFSKIKMLKVEDKPVRWLSKEEFNAILKKEKNPTFRAIWQLGVLTGLRLNALLNLKWNDINLEKGILVLHAVSSKNGRNAVLPINSQALEILQSLYNPKNVFVFQKKYSCGVAIPLSGSYVSHKFLTVCREAKVENCHFHVLRKTFGSWLLAGGCDIYSASKLLTHQSVVTTQRSYLGLDLGLLTESITKISL